MTPMFDLTAQPITKTGDVYQLGDHRLMCGDWDKVHIGLSNGWRMQHEIIMCATRGKYPWDRKAGRGNVIQALRTGNENHPTEKPVGLIEELLKVANLETLVYDPFAGAGSSLLAAERQGRTWYGMEIEPFYCDRIVRRWQGLTGQEAKLL